MQCIIKNVGEFSIDENQLKALVSRLDAVIVNWDDIVLPTPTSSEDTSVEINGETQKVSIDAQDITLHSEFPSYLVGLSRLIEPVDKVVSVDSVAALVRQLQEQQQFQVAQSYTIWFFIES